MFELGSAVFLSWVRGALATQGVSPVATAAPRLVTTVDANAISGGVPEPVSARFELYGPADVAGIAPSQILRTDPKIGTSDAEPNYLCSIEFDAPELPWALSPEAPSGPDGAILQPWIALVVVKDEPGRIEQRSGASLPLLRCPSAQLPPCEESWAWAHAQVVPRADRALDDLLTDPAEGAATLSRLLCPTRLLPNTRYLACVVPTYEAGVRVQSSHDLTGVGLNRAWGSTAQAELPVYYSWRFGTGDGGDFEEIASQLRPVVADTVPGLGRTDLSLPADAIPGVAMVPALPAVRTMLTTDTELDRMRAEAVPAEVQQRLADIVSPDNAGIGPAMVQPPMYGRWPAQIQHLGPETAGWVGELNRSPAHRIVARLGADMVRAQQEELVAEARRQAGEYVQARAARDRLRLAELTSARLFERRLEVSELSMAIGLNPGEASRIIALARPSHREIEFESGTSVADRISGSIVDPSLFGRSMARITARASAQMRVPQMALRREMVAGSFNREFTARSIESPTLTGQVDRLKDIFGRAGILDNEIGATTIGAIISASGLVASAQSALMTKVEEQPLAFIDAVQIDDGPFQIGHRGQVGRHGQVGRLGKHGLDDQVFQGGHQFIDENAEPLHLKQVLDAQALQVGHRFIEENAEPLLLEQQLDQQVVAAAGQRVFIPLDLTPIGDFTQVGQVQRRLALTTDSHVALTALVDNALGPVAELLGTQLSTVDVATFAVDDATAALAQEFRTKTSGTASAVVNMNVAAAVRSRLGLEVVEPIHRDRLSPIEQVDFDAAATSITARTLTASIAFPLTAGPMLDATEVASACVEGLRPSRTHTSAMSRVILHDQLPVQVSPFRLALGFVPQFSAPVAARLERSLNAWILAGAGELPANTVTLLATNPAFVEAFVVGANHEVAAEMLWRDIPSDPRGTTFTQFWAHSPLAPMVTWSERLGHNVAGGKALVAVVVRSPLLKRYPNTVVYAAKRLDDGAIDFTPDPTTVTPVLYQGFIEPDASYSVLDLDLTEARDPTKGWFVLISQPVTDARFGLDLNDTPAAQPTEWKDMDWSHLGAQPLSPLNTPVLPTNRGQVRWGESAADMAYALHQDPFRVVLPAAHYLPAPAV